MGGYGQSIAQLNQGSTLGSSLNAGLPIATSMASNGSSLYQAHYGLNSLGKIAFRKSSNGIIRVQAFHRNFVT